LLEQFPEEVKVVFKNFPLKSQRFSLKAAQASLAAAEQGKFREFHDRLFENHARLNDAVIKQISEELALDFEKLSQDMNSTAIRNILIRDLNEGRRIGIRGIPAVLVNGKMAESRSFEDLAAMVEEELRAAEHRR